MSDWIERNNRYLAASLEWLRLRLARLEPTPPISTVPPHPATATPASAAATAPAGRRNWLLFKASSSADSGTASATQAPAVLLPASSADQGEPALAAAARAREEAAGDDPPPALIVLAQRLGLSDFERDTLLLCAAVEIDPGIAELYARVQGANMRAPTFALALQALEGASWDALSPHRPLRYARLVEPAPTGATPLTLTPLRVDERIAHYLKGLNVLDERLSALLMPTDPGEAPLSVSQRELADAVLAQLQAAGREAQIPLIQLVGNSADSKIDVARHVSRTLGRHLYVLGSDALPQVKADVDAIVRLWQRERLLLPIALLVDADDLPSTPAEAGQALFAFASRDIGLAFVSVREMPARPFPSALAFEVNKPTAREQHDAWRSALEASAMSADAGSAAPVLAGHFDMSLRDIRQSIALAQAASGDAPAVQRVWRACRKLSQPRLDQLAQRIDPRAGWDDLVLCDEAIALLRQVAGQVRTRFRVYEDWGYAARTTRGLGISALFAGESGTGKTMAAEVLAGELDLALYRIDLSAVVSKYIGETEKNLRRVFDAAEQGGAILFFDEADALFGKRSEVKDSHDRYANIEINYLLQRMEGFSGLAILATNMRSALDTAFMRRLRFVINFPYPGPAERRRIWQRALGEVPREAVDLDRLARFNLSGGNIQVIALNAAFMAAAHGTPLTQPMLLNAVRTELRKLEKPVSEAEFRR